MYLVNLKTKSHAVGHISCLCIERAVFNFSLHGLSPLPNFSYSPFIIYFREETFFNYGRSKLCFVFYWIFLRPCNSRWTGTNPIYQADFRLTEIHLPLPMPPVGPGGGGWVKGIHCCTWPSYGLEFLSFWLDVL